MSDILPFCQVKLQYLLDLVLDQSLDDNAFRVAAYLALTHADHDTGECHPSFETIGTALGRHAKSVTPRLSERLNADLEALRHENAALMASQLQSFRSDLTAIATRARDIIEADTRMFLHATSGTMLSFQHRITRWLTLAPVILLATATAAITALLVLSWLWSVMLSKSELTRLGLQRIDQGGMTYLLTDPARARIQTCAISEQRSVLCIQISEK